MDRPRDHEPENEANAVARQPNEAEVRAMLEESRRDIAKGRTVALEPVLEHMRASAERVRNRKVNHTGVGRRPA